MTLGCSGWNGTQGFGNSLLALEGEKGSKVGSIDEGRLLLYSENPFGRALADGISLGSPLGKPTPEGTSLGAKDDLKLNAGSSLATRKEVESARQIVNFGYLVNFS